MRVTGGRYRGRRIICPKGMIRPAMDRMRESLFAILGDLSGLSFLDLFTGSGVVGIEAASRNAAPVVLVEKDRAMKSIILKNLKLVDSETELCILPVERYILREQRCFDLIYLDPPFSYSHKLDLLERIDQAGLFAPNGIVVLHLPKKESLPPTIGSLGCYDRRSYGGSVLLFYRSKS